MIKRGREIFPYSCVQIDIDFFNIFNLGVKLRTLAVGIISTIVSLGSFAGKEPIKDKPPVEAAVKKEARSIEAYEITSCTDFGGGCNPFVFSEFQTSLLLAYPKLENGSIEGAVKSHGGVVHYDNLDACSWKNNQSLLTTYGEQMKRWIPVELPRNGGLACVDSMVFDISFQHNYQNMWSIDASNMIFSEFAAYGYTSKWASGTMAPISKHVLTKYINLAPRNTTDKNNHTAYNDFETIKSRAISVNVPLMCNLKFGKDTTNPDCRGLTCKKLGDALSYNSTLGVCFKE